MKRGRSGEEKEELKEDERMLRYKPMTWGIKRPPVEDEEEEEKEEEKEEEGKQTIGFPKTLSDYYRIAENITSPDQMGTWVDDYVEREFSVPVGKVLQFFRRLENGDRPLLYVKEKITPEEEKVYSKSLPNLPDSLIDLIYSTKGPDIPYDSCYNPVETGGYKRCRKSIADLENQYEDLSKVDISESLCIFNCLLRNLPTYITISGGYDRDDEKIPFAGTLIFEFGKAIIIAKIIYDEDELDHKIDFKVKVTPNNSDGDVEFDFVGISIDDLMEMISFFGDFSRIVLSIDTEYDDEDLSEIAYWGPVGSRRLWTLLDDNGIVSYPTQKK